MARTESAGAFEQLVLTAILTLRDNAYGVSIHAKVEQLSRPKKISLGAVYITLERLEQKGMISSRRSAPTAERGGRSKRCYGLKPMGERALQESALTSRRVFDSLIEIWGEGWATQ